MDFSPLSLVLIALVLAAWAVGAAMVVLRANQSVKRAKAMRTSLKRMQTLLDVAPALPLLVRVDGRIEAPEKLARMLGLAAMPKYLSELAAPAGNPKGGGLAQAQLDQLWSRIQTTQKSAAPFRMAINLPGAQRSLALYGTLADPQVSPGGAALVWVFDFTESHSEMARLRAAAARATGDFAALVGLIEAAPMPMWFRGSDLTLQLVNQAYVDAVGASTAAEVVQSQIELLEPDEGRSPADIARATLTSQAKSERIIAATIHGARRTLRVSDLPLGLEGVAGYAIDIEEQQQVAREFRAFRDAQRALLDQLSVGVALFDGDERLTFANRPFRRLFSLAEDAIEAHTPFERFLAEARERGRTPEVRDFPEWRRERTGWFGMQDTQEEAWPLPGGTHLRVVAQPMPDGGLILITEDRTESLALSAVRDTLLRTRTATLDSLFEALAIFAPDGSVQLWNRSFAGTWGLTPELLDLHPSADELLSAIGRNLVKPEEAGLIGAAVRAATLDRREKGGQVDLADGRTLRFAGIPLPDGNGLLTVLDITASQKAEQALRERAEALEEADAVKAKFLANMSYEFRTPLTTIGGYAELLKSGAAADPEAAGEYVDAILSAVERLTEQVENVLDLSQSEAGLLPIRKERLDLLDFLTTLVRDRETAIVAAGLSLDLKGRRGRVIEADPRQMGRAIGNLLDNAVVGTPEGGRIVIEIRRAPEGTEWGVEISIADNGRGMTSKELARAQGGVKPAGEGAPERRTGLGIPLARQLIAAHDGTLEIVSRKGAGTTATIRLP
ncbi:signal transduction histidine kinase [Erythromicrobium ramosum]|uniref:histidine kinase n=1 Tax=Erythrobacter ramosus TaxID=35811 RepID=A0A6I4ULJ3_9SPHN|nr:PAS domain-containing sensor histidine kinase [Erythrobacter ramosus]MBB3776253.1 signal transduction histidine kinase [Erythrobacter ramosus]MXP38664.1 PAS domain-containing protein [Erythrobacter ramosus]